MSMNNARFQSYTPAESIAAPDRGFVFTPTDSTNILDPNLASGVDGIVARAVTTRTDGDLKVTYAGSATPVVVPMLAGVRRSMIIRKIWSTGTTGQIVSDGVVVEYGG